MRIIVDADSCSKIRQIEEIAEEKGKCQIKQCIEK